MKNIAVINGINLSPYAHKVITHNKSSLDMAGEYARNLPEVESIVLLTETGAEVSGSFKIYSKNFLSIRDLLLTVSEVAKDYDNIFYFYADCPFLDLKISENMYRNHIKYFAEYTFADGYPYGITPEIIKTGILSSLIKLMGSGDNKISRDTFFELIKKDINAFDIETTISPEDLRLLRVSLSMNNRRNYMLGQRVVELGGNSASGISGILKEHGEILRTLPAYVSMQIVEGCIQLCSYCPYSAALSGKTGKKDQMSLSKIDMIINKVKDFADDAVLNISLWGEPSLYSDIDEVISRITRVPGLDVLIETSGLGWNRELLERIRDKTDEPPTWIISLDAVTEPVYTGLRGRGFKDALANTEEILRLFEGNVHVQAVRMKDNEEELEKFYRYWKSKLENVIIQKYDDFCGVLPDRKVTDLSPLKRFPCWHLKRDLNILLDGSVPFCREDLSKKNLLGNIFKDSIEEIWKRGEQLYLKHLKADYPELCLKCDEYYTYNF